MPCNFHTELEAELGQGRQRSERARGADVMWLAIRQLVVEAWSQSVGDVTYCRPSLVAVYRRVCNCVKSSTEEIAQRRRAERMSCRRSHAARCAISSEQSILPLMLHFSFSAHGTWRSLKNYISSVRKSYTIILKIKANFHYASWFGAGSEPVRSFFGASSEPASVMEFGTNQLRTSSSSSSFYLP